MMTVLRRCPHNDVFNGNEKWLTQWVYEKFTTLVKKKKDMRCTDKPHTHTYSERKLLTTFKIFIKNDCIFTQR